MQSVMYHPKCHSFSNTIIMLFLGDGQEKVVQGIHQHCHYFIFLSTAKLDCKRSQILVERKIGRQLLPEQVQLCVLRFSALLCAQVQFTSHNHITANGELWGQNTLGPEYFGASFVTGTSKQH